MCNCMPEKELRCNSSAACCLITANVAGFLLCRCTGWWPEHFTLFRKDWEAVKKMSCGLGYVAWQQRVTWGMEVPWVNPSLETGFIFCQAHSSLSCFHMLTKACPENLFIYYCSYHIVLVLGQEPKMLTAVYELYMKIVSGNLYSDASVLHRFRYL